MTLRFKNEAAYAKWAADPRVAKRLRLAAVDGATVTAYAPSEAAYAAPEPRWRPSPPGRLLRRAARRALRWIAYGIVAALPGGWLLLMLYFWVRR